MRRVAAEASGKAFDEMSGRLYTTHEKLSHALAREATAEAQR